MRRLVDNWKPRVARSSYVQLSLAPERREAEKLSAEVVIFRPLHRTSEHHHSFSPILPIAHHDEQ